MSLAVFVKLQLAAVSIKPKVAGPGEARARFRRILDPIEQAKRVSSR